MSTDINILIGQGIEETDKNLFFGPLFPEDQFCVMDSRTTWADLLVKFGLFPSKGQARKNGWDMPIPDGWSRVIVGKKRTLICVLKIM